MAKKTRTGTVLDDPNLPITDEMLAAVRAALDASQAGKKKEKICVTNQAMNLAH